VSTTLDQLAAGAAVGARDRLLALCRPAPRPAQL
jgi:hypothetical protein